MTKCDSGQLLATVPLHRQVYRELRGDILKGVYAPGSQIPTESDLINRFGVSKITVRRAVQDLIAERVLVGHRGRGTFVKSGKFVGSARLLFLHGKETPTGHPYTQLILDGVTESSDTLGPDRAIRLELAALPPLGEQTDDDTTVEDLVEHAGIEGIVALPRLRLASLNRLNMMDVPVVLVGRVPFRVPPGAVNIDVGGIAAIESQLKHLLSIRASKIGVLTDRRTHSPTHLDRVHKLMEQLGIPIIDDAWERVDYGINDGKEGALRLLRRIKNLDAILAEDDLGAIGALQAAYELGIRVPHDMAIIGCGDMIGDHSHCNISTIDTKLKHVGKLAVQTVLRMISGDKVESPIVVSPILVRRNTT